MKWLSIAALFGCGPANEKTASGSLASGGLEIRWDVYQSRSGAWFNNGGNPNAKVSTSYFSIFHRGQPVSVPAAAGKVDQFWQALFLQDAPRPAILAGIHSMYLISEDSSGQLQTRALHEQDGDFATYQWLDSENGQPGESRNVYLGDDSKNPRELSGGRMLIVNGRVVLDVKTLEAYPYDVNSWERVQQLDGYNAFNSWVYACSPGHTQLVLIGNRSNPADYMLYQYALVVIDFIHNTAYAVPFDRSDTQFFSVWDGNVKWLETYFTWTKDKAGAERLTLRHYDRLPYWQGRWDYDEATGQPVQYKLMPIEKSMIGTFLDFVQSEVAVSALRTETVSDLISTYITIDGTEYLLYYYPEYQQLTFNGANIEMVIRLGKRFDEELAKGRFQEDFGRFP